MTASGHQNGSIYIFNNTTRKMAHSLSGLVKPVRAVAFSPANKYLAAAGDAQIIAIYDTTSGEQVANLTGHASWIMSLSWNWSGEYLLSGFVTSQAGRTSTDQLTDPATSSYDGKAKIWSFERRECVATQTESEKCLWAVQWLPKAANARYDTPVDKICLNTRANVIDRNELFVTAGANKSLSFYREASGT